MKKRLIAVLLLAILGAGAWWLWRARPDAGSDLRHLTLYGNIDVRLVNLAFEVSGRISELPVTEGARVAVGQPVGRLDDRRWVQARDAARAAVEAQRAELAKRIAGSRPEELAKLRADHEAARVEAVNTATRAHRAQDLYKRKLGSAQDADDASSTAEAAAALAQATQAALDLGLAGTRAEDITAAAAQLAALEAELAAAELNLAYATLRSPVAGVVQNRILEVGDMASPDRPVYTITITEPLWARVYLAEPDLGRVKPGQPAQVMSDSFPGKAYPGWVGYIAPSAEFTPKTVQTTALRADLVYQARVYVCNPAGELRQGMLSVRENLDLYADLQGVSPAARADRYARLMQMTGLGPFGARLAGRLSGGMKQKLGLACTLVKPPRLLLLDEPTVGVDPVSRRELWAIVYRLVVEEGMTVLLSTAYLDEAERCAEVILLHQGRLIDQGSPAHFSAPLAGRIFRVTGPSATRRRLQAALAQRPGVLDAVLQAGCWMRCSRRGAGCGAPGRLARREFWNRIAAPRLSGIAAGDPARVDAAVHDFLEDRAKAAGARLQEQGRGPLWTRVALTGMRGQIVSHRRWWESLTSWSRPCSGPRGGGTEPNGSKRSMSGKWVTLTHACEASGRTGCVASRDAFPRGDWERGGPPGPGGA